MRIVSALLAVVGLGGCVAYTVVETAADVAGAAVDVTTTAVGAGVSATAGAVRLAIPGGDDDEDAQDR